MNIIIMKPNGDMVTVTNVKGVTIEADKLEIEWPVTPPFEETDYHKLLISDPNVEYTGPVYG